MEAKTSTSRRTGQRKAFRTTDLLKRAKNCRRRVFTLSEDKIIIRCVSSSKFDNDWDAVAKLLSHRSARQCRDRWMYYLSPTNNLEPFSSEEDQLIVQKVNELGKKWSQISKYFKGRSDNSIKNRWYSKLASRCDVNESGVYSLDPKKMIDQNEKKLQVTSILNLNQEENFDKNEVSEPEYINDQKFIPNNSFSTYPLSFLHNQEYDEKIKNFCDFWDGEFLEWPSEISSENSHPQLDFF